MAEILAVTQVAIEIGRRLVFGLGMKKPEPHIDEDGNRYFNVRQAAEIVGGVCEATMWNWAEAGETKFRFKLRTKRIPVLHHRHLDGEEAPPQNPKKDRIVIFEADILALKEILHAAGRTQPGPWSPYERATLEAKAYSLKHRRVDVTLPHP